MKFRNTKKQQGQSLVESALIIPLVLLLIFTFLDLGRGVYYYSALGNAVREGARYASVTKLENTSVEADIKEKVNNYSVAVKPSTVTVAITGSDSDYVTVSASYIFTPITPFLAQILGSGNTITLNAETSMLLAPIARQ